MKLTRKIGFALGGAGLLFLSCSAVAFHFAQTSRTSISGVRHAATAGLAAAQRLASALTAYHAALDDAASATANEWEARLARLQRAGTELAEAHHAVQTSRPPAGDGRATPFALAQADPLPPEESALLDRVGQSIGRLTELEANLKTREPLSGEQGQAFTRELETRLQPAVRQLTEQTQLRLSRDLASAATSFDRLLVIVIVTCAGLLALAGLLAVSLYRHIIRPLRRIEATTKAISAGDRKLRLTPLYPGNDELGALAAAFDHMLDSLNATTVHRDELERAVQARTSELQQSEQQLRDLFDNTTELIQSVTPDGRFAYVNRAWLEALGFQTGEVAGLTLFDIIAPEHHPHCRQLFQRLLGGEQVGSFEITFRTKQGRPLLVEGHVNARREEGRPLLTRGIFRDITSRHQAEQAVREQVTFLSAMSQTTLDLLARRQLPELLQAIVERAALILDAPYAEISLLEHDELVVRSVHGPPVSAPGDRAGRGQAVLSFQAIDRRQPMVVEDFSAYPNGRSIYQRWGFRAVAVLPIQHGPDCLGVIGLLRQQPGHVFSREDVHKAQLVAQLAALILQNAGIYEDARREAEAKTTALSQSEQRFRQLVENIGQGFYTANARSNFTFVNPSICAVMGKTAEQMVGTSSFRLVVEADRRRVIDLYRGWAKSTETDVVCEFRVDRADGRRSWVEQLTRIQRTADGSVQEYQCFLRDITERKQAELELRESEERFRSVFGASPVVIALLSVPDGRIIEANAAAERTFGYTLDEVRGKTSTEVGLWVNLADRDRYLHLLSTHGHVSAFEVPMRRKDGTELVILYNGSLVTIGGRKFSLNTLLDITAHRQAEQARRESEELYSQVVANIGDGLVHLDESGRVLFANAQFCQMFGHPPARIRDLTIRDLVPPELVGEISRRLQARLAGEGVPTHNESMGLRRDGTRFWVDVSATPLLRDGRVVGTQCLIQDISERKRAAAEIERLALLARETDSAVLIADRHGAIDWVNEGFTRLNGYTLAEVRGRKPGTLLRGPKSDPAIIEEIRLRLAQRAQFSVDILNYPKAGAPYWARLSILPWHDSSGEYQGYLSMTTDITDRVLEEKTTRLLAAQEPNRTVDSFLRSIAGALPVLLDLEGCLIGLLRNSDHSRFHTHGFSLDGQLQPDFAAPVAGSFAEAALHAGPQSRENACHLFPSDPLLQRHLVNGLAFAPLAGSDGSPRGFIAVFSPSPLPRADRIESILHRVALKLQAELARDEAEGKFRDLFAFAPDAILITSADGHISDANQRALEMFGFAREELLHLDAGKLVPPEHRPAFTARLRTYLADPGTSSHGHSSPGLVAWDRQGRTFPVELRLSPLRTEHGSFIVAAVRDITRQLEMEESRRQAESNLRQSQRIESLGTLAGGIAHDFNNILTGILGAAEIARTEISPDHAARPWLDQIGSAGQRARSLVQKIMTFSRKGESQMAPLRAQDVVHEAVLLLRSTLPTLVQLEASIDPDCPPVLADATQIHQVVMNLCTNAWHALPPQDGLIEVKLAPVAVPPGSPAVRAGLSPGPALQLTVRDNGCGMPAEVQERIFEPFFTTKAPGRGTGLGLAVVHGIIRSHQGTILLHSQSGVGTTFEIYLPLIARTAAEVDTVETGAIAATPSRRILLVDDDPLSLGTLHGLLKRQGHRVSAHANPVLALRTFESQPDQFDLVMTDYAMPGLSGLNFAQQLQNRRPDIPIIVISGFLDASATCTIHANGIRRILSKPPSIAEINAAIAEVGAPSASVP